MNAWCVVRYSTSGVWFEAIERSCGKECVEVGEEPVGFEGQEGIQYCCLDSNCNSARFVAPVVSVLVASLLCFALF
jgi:hypothetical protein